MDLGLLASLLPVLAGVTAAFGWFLHLERTDRSVTVVMALVWLLIADAVIYQSQNEVPVGLLHPEVGSVSFRPIDVAIPLALAARLWACGLPSRFDPRSLLWAALLVWLVAATAVGAYVGNSPGEIAFQAKMIVYLSGIYIASGVPFAELLEPRRLGRLVFGTAALAVVLLVLDSLGTGISAQVPLLPLANFGVLGSDAATIFVTIGLIGIAVGLTSETRNLGFLVAGGVLVITPLMSNQRAAVLGLVVGLAVLAAGLAFARRPIRVTRIDLGLAAAALVACVLASVQLQLWVGGSAEFPLQDELTTEFGGYESTLTNQVRANQWYSVRELVEERPLFGWGLGKEFAYYEPGFKEFQVFDSVHNIGGDLLLRSGAIGLGLFLAALIATVVGALSVARRAVEDVAAAVSVALLAGAAGLLAKGMVEDLFEKYRLISMLTLVLGLMISAAATVRQTSGVTAGAWQAREQRLGRIMASRAGGRAG